MPTEKRFYLIFSNDFYLSDFSEKSPNELTDSEFMEVCESDGFTLSCEEMAEMINEGEIIEHYCRYI